MHFFFLLQVAESYRAQTCKLCSSFHCLHHWLGKPDLTVDWNSTYNLNNLFFKIFNPNFFQKCHKSENEYPNIFLIFLHVKLADISGIAHSKLNSWIFALKIFPLSVLSTQRSSFSDSRSHTYLWLLCYLQREKKKTKLGLNLDCLFFCLPSISKL